MATLIIDKRNVALSYYNQCIVMHVAGDFAQSIPLCHTSSVVCLHNVEVTTQLLGILQEHSIDFAVHNHRYDTRTFALYSEHSQVVNRRIYQYSLQLNEAVALAYAVAICRHKFNLLTRSSAHILSDHNRKTVEESVSRIDYVSSLGELRGLEGFVQKLQFDAVRKALPAKYPFYKRVRRPPTDPVNALLSLSYMLVYHETVRQIKIAGLDPHLGFYHRPLHGRFSLACDLMEPLRPGVENFVVDTLCQGNLNEKHFGRKGKACLLGKQGRTLYYELIASFMPRAKLQLQASCRWLARKIDNAIGA